MGETKHIIQRDYVPPGGARANSGRRKIPSEDKKKQISVMIKSGYLEELGGKEAVQKIMQDAVEHAYLAKKINES